jgi:hypothetical protein
VIPLDFDVAVADGSTASAALLELFGKIIER